MSDDNRKSFLVVLDLSRFFCDHRRVARIFIKKNIKTIQDLQNRISEVFGIHGFYLSTGGHFLPVSEDIKILNNGETISVNPDNVDASKDNSKFSAPLSSGFTTTEKKLHKRTLEDIPKESSVHISLSKKKNKKEHIYGENSSSNGCESAKSYKKVKVKHTIKESDLCNTENIQESNTTAIDNINLNNSVEDEKTSKKEKIGKKKKEGLVEKRLCNIEANQKVSEIKDTLKQKVDKYFQKHSNNTVKEEPSSFKTVLPKLQNHIKNCNDLGRSTGPDIVRLSRHIDTPIKTTKYTPPERITDQYLAKNKINIVKIDVIKENLAEFVTNICNTENNEEDVTSSSKKDHNSPPEIDVKTVKQISPKKKSDKNKHISTDIYENGLQPKQSEASNYTKAYLDQKDVNTISESKTDSTNICNIPSSTNSSVSVKKFIFYESKFENNQSTENIEQENSNKSLDEHVPGNDISLDTSSIPQNSYSSLNSNYALNLSSISTESNNNSSQKSKKITGTKLFSGVGSLIENLRESDSVLSQESDASSLNITKRKRIRKRKRSKKNEDEQIEFTQFKSPKTISDSKSYPNTHIKFDDNIVDITEKNVDLSQVNASEGLNIIKETCGTESDPHEIENNVDQSLIIETLVLSDENEDPVLENKPIFGNDNILKAPFMGDKLEPKIGDIIAFKILKITENYTPQVSNYIIGQVEMYLSESKTVYFKILSGKEELSPITGKLSLDLTESEDIRNSKYKEIGWNEVLEPKLLFP